MTGQSLRAGAPFPLGASHDGEGVNFAVFSEHASRIELCLFSADGLTETARLPLRERSGPVWHGYLPGLGAGALYGYRAHGPYAPEQGHRFNHHKLLIDPYARRFAGRWRLHDALFGYDRNAAGDDLSFSTLDSAPYTPRAVVTAPGSDRSRDTRPRRNPSETVIYEAHAKGLTRLFPGLPDDIRGTYDALASGPVIEHLIRLGINAVELMPVQAFVDEPFLHARGLTNYWGYNTIGFFALEPRYAGPSGEAGFRHMVRRLHAAGIEVILDVAYNHTAEGDRLGPTLSFRGLDNASYYRLDPGQPRDYVNDTGCGNTLDLSHPFVLRMVMDSLRYWVTEMAIDGFRFDLGTVLGREDHGFSAHSGFFDAIRQDPVLAGTRLIAEPWDVGPGGYRLGEFPPEFSEWNDGYRDSVRRFWRGTPHAAQDLAGRLLGSASKFDRPGRGPQASVNMVTAHDGFTLADLTSYEHKRNHANGEDNNDGHDANHSDNCGAEGPTDDADVLARRRRRRMNLLATLFLSQGTPMLRAGDEVGHSQGGNNNAYCQDNATTWIDWQNGDAELLAFTCRLTAFRRANPVLRQTRFLHGRNRAADGLADVSWRRFDGGAMNWRDPGLQGFCLVLRGSAEAPEYAETCDGVFIAINGSDRVEAAVLPDPGEGRIWQREIDTAAPVGPGATCSPGGAQTIEAHSVVAFSLTSTAGA